MIRRLGTLVGLAVLAVSAAACESDNPTAPNPGPGGTAVTLASLSVSSAEVDGGAVVQGTATLSGAAATGGTLVSLSSSSSAATVPASITVPAGSTSATFSITTSEVATTTNVTILGSSGGANRSAALRVRASEDPGTDPGTPSAPARIEARHDDLVGGRNTTATVTLSAAAPSGGVVLRFASDDEAVEVPATLTIPAGAKSATFQIKTEPVAATRTATIRVTGDIPAARQTTAAVATVALNLTLRIRLLPPGNEPPAAANDSYSLSEDTPLAVNAPGVLGNDSDANSDDLTATLVDDVDDGTLSLSANGSFIYTPEPDFSGAVTFTYRASDGTATSNLATVTLTVNPVNDTPTISGVADQTIDEDSATNALDFTVGDVETAAGSLTMSGSSNDTDIVPDANIVFGGSGANRTVTVTPAPDANGVVTITLTVSDGAATASDTFELTINSINDAPTISFIPDHTVIYNQTRTYFTIGDDETPADELSVSFNSSVPALWMAESTGITASERNLRYSFSSSLNGNTATITLRVSDGIETTTTTFVVFLLFSGLLTTAVPRRRRKP